MPTDTLRQWVVRFSRAALLHNNLEPRIFRTGRNCAIPPLNPSDLRVTGLFSILNRQTFELAYIQVVKKSSGIQKLLVCTLLDDLAVIDYDNMIGIADG